MIELHLSEPVEGQTVHVIRGYTIGIHQISLLPMISRSNNWRSCSLNRALAKISFR